MTKEAMKKDNLFNNWFSENQTATYKRMKLEYSLILQTIINSKCTKDLDVRPDTIEFLEETQNTFWT